MNPRFEPVRRAQLAAAGGAFLRRRPWVVWPAAAVQLATLWSSPAPRAQCVAVSVGVSVTALAFSLEARWLRARAPSERWLRASLALTLVALALGCAGSGALRSPLLPLLFAPTGVAFAAFGFDAPARVQLALLGVALGGLALAGPRAPFGPPAPGYSALLYATSTLASAALLWLGVGGLVAAYRRAGEALDALHEASLRDAAARARELETLTARVAHELRNPLAAVKGLTQLLARDLRDERARARVDVALGEVDRMEATLASYLARARPLADAPDATPAPIEARALLEQVRALLAGRAAQGNVRVELACDDGALEGDAAALREALLNLGRNGLDAMPRGGALALDGRYERDAQRWRFTVLDEGEGLDEATRPRLGEAYVTTRAHGTGLGLRLAREAAERHGGALALRPRDDGRSGTVAELTVRARAAGASEGAEPAR